MDLSAKVRTSQMNQAAGVGGVFVAVMLGPDTVLRSTDVFHVHANSRLEVQFFCKVLFRRGLYFVNDVIGRKGFAMRSLEEEVSYRLGRNPTTEDVTAEVTELLQFQARALLLDVRSPDAPDTPNVHIVENLAGTAISGMKDLPLGAYPEPGSPLQLRAGSSYFDLTVRR